VHAVAGLAVATAVAWIVLQKLHVKNLRRMLIRVSKRGRTCFLAEAMFGSPAPSRMPSWRAFVSRLVEATA
jgi:hypothetical protein